MSWTSEALRCTLTLKRHSSLTVMRIGARAGVPRETDGPNACHDMRKLAAKADPGRHSSARASVPTASAGRDEAQAAVLARGRVMVPRVELDVLDRVAERAAAAIADREVALHGDDRDRVDALLRRGLAGSVEHLRPRSESAHQGR